MIISGSMIIASAIGKLCAFDIESGKRLWSEDMEGLGYITMATSEGAWLDHSSACILMQSTCSRRSNNG